MIPNIIKKQNKKQRNCIWHKKNFAGMRTCTYNSFASCADALTICANAAMWINDSTSNISHNFFTALEKMHLIKTLFFRWHRISPKGYRQVFTKIDKHHVCQLNNVILSNLSGLDLVRRSRSMSKVTDMDVSAFSECFLFFLLAFLSWK